MPISPREAQAARPILKWAGGKSRIVSEIVERLPQSIETYYEPFLGGAAVFFALAAEQRFRHAVLSDTNRELIDMYRAVQQDVEGLIAALERYRDSYDEETYYRVRDARPPRKLAERAARLIFLNKTGYNGLYRVNRSGQFNVPFGRYKNPTICDPVRLRAAAHALAAAELCVADFAEVSRAAGKRDAVYLDPPYHPLSKTSNFTAYGRSAFEFDDQQRLAREFERLARRAVPAVLSNSNTRATRALYASHRIDTVRVSRPINSKAEKRGNVTEILVSSAACEVVRR